MQIPQFCVGQYSKIQPAIDAGIITYPAYVMVTDDSEYHNRFIFIDKNKNLQPIEGTPPTVATRNDIDLMFNKESTV